MGRRWGRDFDEHQIRLLIREMTRRWKFYRVLKQELKRRGNWKDRPRGRSVAN